jgi:hypothetical protein
LGYDEKIIHCNIGMYDLFVIYYFSKIIYRLFLIIYSDNNKHPIRPAVFELLIKIKLIEVINLNVEFDFLYLEDSRPN